MYRLSDWEELSSFEYQEDYYIKKFIRYLEGTKTEIVQINVARSNMLNVCRVYFFPNIYIYMTKPKTLKNFQSKDSIDIVKLKVSIMLSEYFELDNI